MTIFTRHNPTDDLILHGRVLASPAKPRAVIAVVHGFGEHTGRYTGIAEGLGELGFAVLGLDLHGHGSTPGRRGYVKSYTRFHEDVEMLLVEARSRFPGLSVYLWGHSMGGGLVLDFVFENGALEREEGQLAGVIATAPLIEAVDPPPAPLFAVMKLLEKAAPKLTLRNPITGEQISTLPEEQARYAEDTLNHDKLTLALGSRILESGKRTASRKGAFPVPLLLMHSRDDTLTRFEASERFARGRDNCNFHPFEGVAHELHNDSSRGEVLRLIDAFVTDTLPARTA